MMVYIRYYVSDSHVYNNLEPMYTAIKLDDKLKDISELDKLVIEHIAGLGNKNDYFENVSNTKIRHYWKDIDLWVNVTIISGISCRWFWLNDPYAYKHHEAIGYELISEEDYIDNLLI